MNTGSAAPEFESTDLYRIIQRYQTDDEIQSTRDAYEFAAEAHKSVTRKSGELYIYHPLEVARILADLHMDVDTICAALLHDVVEDTEHTKEEIAERYGSVVAELVDGVTKLAGNHFTSRTEASEASFQKMMVAMTQDYRVVLIKLADRLHNMRTLGSMPAEKKRRIAKETIQIHAPLARRMGMHRLRKELQTLCLMHLHPWRYKVLEKSVAANYELNQETYDRILDDLTQALRSQNVSSSCFLWEKNLYRIYSDAQRFRSNKYLSNEADGIEIRILVDKVPDCYLALGVVHQLYRPKVGKFEDYIAARKAYGYQALQTELMTYDRHLLKIEIQTKQMYQVSQYGVTSHFRYPNSMTSLDFSKTYLNRWIKQVAEIQNTNGSPSEFMEDIKSDLFLEDIQVYTPRGEIKTLPHGSTPIDFAYEIHTDVGNHCDYATVDHRRVSLGSQLKNGVTVRIHTSEDARPQPNWINFVTTGKARAAIRHWINSRKDNEYIELGKELLNQALEPYNAELSNIPENHLNKTLKVLNLDSTEMLLSHISQGVHCSKLIARRLMDEDSLLKASDDNPDRAILIRGTEGLAVELQKCCYPMPDDIIVGQLEKGRGMAIHRANCPEVQNISPAPLKISWADNKKQQTYSAAVTIEVRNRVGAISSVTHTLQGLGVNIEELHVGGEQDAKTCHLIIEVMDSKHLRNIARKLQELELVISVIRSQ
ncbi:bifunctional (p)ppGpp synthetase/guanosine-3',5'-bis(diphosphate) 3'-pyrophosphohydrolase [Leucothrix sargassi]|nr:bifunctional (p)ppGpp synthetase/guanosine-3',5'-bis(diphosphate) 3'-pyrophosphohydrolase [Leucothrix sargassi]